MATLQVITGAAVYPVTVEEAKAHCRVDYADDDDSISGFIQASTEYVEAITHRRYALRTLEQYQPTFGSSIVLEAGPVVAVESIKYDDGDGVEQTLSASPEAYELDAVNAVIYPAANVSWPGTQGRFDSVRIRFSVGYYASQSPEDYRAAIPATAKTAILMCVSDMYDNRDRAQVTELYENMMAKKLMLSLREFD